MPRPTRFSPEVRARAVRMVVEHEAAHESQWAAITSIAEKIGCAAETLRKWVRRRVRTEDCRRARVEFAARGGSDQEWSPGGSLAERREAHQHGVDDAITCKTSTPGMACPHLRHPQSVA